MNEKIEAILKLDEALNALAKTGMEVTVKTTPTLVSACVREKR